MKVPLVKDDNEIINVELVEKKEYYEESIICRHVADLDKLYTGSIDNSSLLTHKDNSDYYVLKPSFKTYVLPGSKRGDKDYKEYFLLIIIISL